MLDLTNLQKPTMTVRLSEALAVDLLPASKGLIDRMARTEKSLEGVYALAAQILSENMQGHTFAAADIDHLGIYEIKLLIAAYMAFIKGLKTDPN